MGFSSLVLAAAVAFGLASAEGATHRNGPLRLLGYFDAKSQQDYPHTEIPHGNLTHVVLTNAVKVDSSGKIHLRPKKFPWEKSGEELVKLLVEQPTQTVLSVRGFPDDTMLDLLAEDPEARQRFSHEMARKAFFLGANGVELEWHSDDVAGGKPVDAPFDPREQEHFSLLCSDLAKELHPRGLTLSVAARPGRKEFASADPIKDNLDWLMVRAYAMPSLGDPHHSSMKDARMALGEWIGRGVPPSKLVLGTPLFAKAGAALRRKGTRDSERLPWHKLHALGMKADPLGDAFFDQGNGKVWWSSGLNTTAEKVRHALAQSLAGVAFRDLHQDARDLPAKSLVQVAAREVRRHLEAIRHQEGVAGGLNLFQRGLTTSKSGEL